MTYPPQQPGQPGGQGPYGPPPGGQQPGHPGQPGPYGPPPGQGPPPGGFGAPQPGQPGQPGPYGPPPGGGFGPPQGPPGQPGQQPPGQQPPGGFGPPPGGGFPGGPGGQPPKGGKKGLWIGISAAAVVVVAALLVTGLAAPGWMLGSRGPHDVAQQLADAYNANDFKTIKQDIICPSVDPKGVDEQQQDLKKHHATVSVTLNGETKVNGDKATQSAKVTLKGDFPGSPKNMTWSVKLEKQEGEWCARSVGRDSSGSSSDSSSGSSNGQDTNTGNDQSSNGSSGSKHQVAYDFLAAMNSGNKSKALSFVCDATRNSAKGPIEKYLSKGLHFALAGKKNASSGGSSSSVANFEVTAAGKSGSGNVQVTSVFGKPCVSIFTGIWV